MGDTVNAAFRIEACTRELQVQCALGSETFKALEAVCDTARFLTSRTVAIKGYEAPITVWAGSFDNLKDLFHAIATTSASPIA